MKRAALVLLLLAACGGAPAEKPCPCDSGELCAYVNGHTTPSCKKPCLTGSTCASGTCTCGSSCAGCKDCVHVCQ